MCTVKESRRNQRETHIIGEHPGLSHRTQRVGGFVTAHSDLCHKGLIVSIKCILNLQKPIRRAVAIMPLPSHSLSCLQSRTLSPDSCPWLSPNTLSAAPWLLSHQLVRRDGIRSGLMPLLRLPNLARLYGRGFKLPMLRPELPLIRRVCYKTSRSAVSPVTLSNARGPPLRPAWPASRGGHMRVHMCSQTSFLRTSQTRRFAPPPPLRTGPRCSGW